VIPEADRTALRQLLRARSSGRATSCSPAGPARRTTSTRASPPCRESGQLLIGRLGLAEIDARGWKPDSVGGLTLGADPVAYAIAHAAAAAGRTIDAFTVRKEAKAHGTGRSSKATCARHSRRGGGGRHHHGRERPARGPRRDGAGAACIGVLSVVDREEGGRARIEAAGLRRRAVHRVGTAERLLPAVTDPERPRRPPQGSRYPHPIRDSRQRLEDLLCVRQVRLVVAPDVFRACAGGSVCWSSLRPALPGRAPSTTSPSTNVAAPASMVLMTRHSNARGRP
jgi:orotate phosphoribosyltransferase